MSLEQTVDTFKQVDAENGRYWAPCLAIALVAVLLFYVALKGLVNESAARAPTLPPAVMPANVEPPVPGTATRSSEEPASPPPHRAPLANATPEAPVIAPAIAPVIAPAVAAAEPPAKAVPAFVEVHKCVMPEGDAGYTDRPCPEGTHASTLRFPRSLHAAATP
ncbi:hypothetical protein [Variovorax paradoxus]|uniref:hypothetical protein n=1 Tax=Variovorax paradoxus TaxID=34073 RepID=UPI0027820C05|nr:hypothetical protein [Variovorax paradoxus]MDP9930437.1 hypothetical protein [Variovorax paradoxus]